MPREPRSILFVWLAAALLSACAQERGPARVVPTHGEAGYVEPQGDRPHVRYGDAGVSINDRCPVRQNKLNLRMAPLFVNGKAVGFC
jgi:hypothetical protein